jgi:acyl-CoA oxidase
MGVKPNLNGVDNAKLMFNQVRIPREQMLNRLCDVAEDGSFHSKYKKASQRFFKVTDRLLSGRLCIASMSMVSCKKSLHSTVRYS